LALTDVSSSEDSPERGPGSARPPSFDDVYRQHVDFLYRSARAFGVGGSAVDDVLQDVFLVVHRRLPEHDGRSVRKWLLRILFNVVREHRRSFRKQMPAASGESADVEATAHGADPEQGAANSEAGRLLLEVLQTMDDDQREVFVLADIEQMPVTEIADAMGTSVNTAYSRLRLARRDYAAAVARLRAREEWRGR